MLRETNNTYAKNFQEITKKFVKFREYFPYRAKIIALLHIEFSNVIDKKKYSKEQKFHEILIFQKYFPCRAKP